jgi:hypothetical protein
MLLLIIVGLPKCWYGNQNGDEKAEQRHFQEQLGTYVLDINKTNLGEYRKDSDIYKKLYITFKSDSTFSMTMKVPFIYDSVGIWNAAGGGLEDWNWLWYKSWGYSDYKKNKGDQFTSPWTKDSIFYLNSTTPQKGFVFIQEIYFKKIPGVGAGLRRK